jgi:hypothetical protein
LKKSFNSISTKIFKIILFSVIIFNVLAADDPTVGLILNDATQSYNGYTLFAPNLAKVTYLIDNEGGLVHQWASDFIPGVSAYLLDDGNLLRTAKISDPTGGSNLKGGFELFDWDGNLVWSFYYGTQHHDIEYLPNGNVLMVTNDRKVTNVAIQAGRDSNLLVDGNIRSLSIIEVQKTGDETGDIVWRWNAWDHLIQDFDNTKDNFGVVADHPELMNVNFAKDGSQDWLHTNSVSYNEGLDQIIVSNRSTHEVWVIDHSTTTEVAATHEGGNSGKGGDLLYRWGNPFGYGAGVEADQKLHGQHDAHWIAPGLPGEGNIMIFSNGWPDRGFSSIEEIVPPVDLNGNYALTAGTAYDPSTQLWTYTTPTQTDFNSQRFGGSQRLPNGNTLICNADSGEFFEVTPTEEIVWKYQNPVDGDNILNQGDQPVGNLQTFRCYKYPLDYSAFDGKDLTPVELAVSNDNNLITEFNLYDNYPNPFNPTTNIEFSLIERGQVTIVVYDVLGNKVKTLANKTMEPGLKNIIWDSQDDSGRPVSSGIYFYKLQMGQQTKTKKMMLLR